MTIKKAKLAGSWYSNNKKELIEDLESYFSNEKFGPGELSKSLNQEQRSIIGGVSPHAGYAFSGCCAAHTFLNLFKEKIPDTVIVIGFHHRDPYGNVILEKGEWETPIGNLKIDNQLSAEFLSLTEEIKSNERAFLLSSENSVELQMPFIKYCAGEKEIEVLPIKLGTHDIERLDIIAEDLSKAILSIDKDIVIVASSDMSHYNVFDETQLNTLKEIDQKVIEQFINLKAEKIINPISFVDDELYNKFDRIEKGSTVCGNHAITTLILTCKKLNANKGKSLKYYTSKDIHSSGHPWTVGYFSGIIMK